MTTLSHITLNLPGELGLVRDVEIDAEINELVHAVIKERVETLNDEDLRGFNGLRGIEETRDVIVDGLVNRLTFLQSFNLRSKWSKN